MMTRQVTSLVTTVLLISYWYLLNPLRTAAITPIPRKKPPLVARSPGTRGGFFLESPKIPKNFACGGLFLTNFEYFLLPETRFLMISSYTKTWFPASSYVFSSARVRLYHSQSFTSCANIIPAGFSSVRTRRYHSQNDWKLTAGTHLKKGFHERSNALLPFAKIITHLQVAQILLCLLFPRVYGHASTIRKTTEYNVIQAA